MADLNSLKQKYAPVLDAMQQQNVQLQNVNMDGDKLYIRGTAPSEDAKNKVWDKTKQIDPQYSDLKLDIRVDQSIAPQTGQQQPQASSPPQGTAGHTYQVQPGDTLSKISQHFYGSPNQYMEIFNANRDVLQNPDQIRVGSSLKIPELKQSA